jgi:hypothetical protein
MPNDVVPDFTHLPRVAPVFVSRVPREPNGDRDSGWSDSETLSVFALGDRFYVAQAATLTTLDAGGRLLGTRPLPTAGELGLRQTPSGSVLVPMLPIDAGRLLWKFCPGGEQVVWTAATDAWLAIPGATLSPSALAWVGESIVEFESTEYGPDTVDMWYETIHVLDLAQRRLERARDKSLGGRLTEATQSSSYKSYSSHDTSSRHSPQSQIEYRCADFLAMLGRNADLCQWTDKRFDKNFFYFDAQYAGTAQAGYSLYCTPGVVAHGGGLGPGASGVERAGRVVARDIADEYVTVAYWRDARLRPLPCARCGLKVWVVNSTCECGEPAPSPAGSDSSA